jgi:CheY-like chemotaxis protein
MTLSSTSVLIVEDDADDQYFISRAFQETGSDALLEIVSDGQSAIDFFEQAPVQRHEPGAPRLVLLDLNLPRKSGLDVLNWIRGNAKWKTIAVVVLTSSTSDDDMRQAYLRGANAYVIKPTDPTKLREFVKLVREFWLSWNQLPALRA